MVRLHNISSLARPEVCLIQELPVRIRIQESLDCVLLMYMIHLHSQVSEETVENRGRTLMNAKIQNQRTNGPVNAHVISGPCISTQHTNPK